MMDLLENYLAAVRRNLPAKDAADITAELRDVLLDRAEEQEANTGSVDWTLLLREFGHPLSVAARYRKEQWLIGPELYPFYVHFLKMIVGIVLLVITAIAVVKGALWASAPGPAITGFLGSMWSAAAATVGSVTIMFVIIERFARRKTSECIHWHPNELPDVLDRQPSVAGSVFEVAAGALILLCWLGVIPTPALASAEFTLQPAPIWAELHWPIAILLAARLIYNLVVWLRPRWTTVRGLLGITTAVGALILAAFIYRAGEWVRVVPTGMPTAEAERLQAALDLALNIAIVTVVIIWVVGIAGGLWKLARRRTEESVTA